ncbi:MAG: glutamate racemase [Oscillospiraceae bacterium]|jgi:glutamate racemase|nr:glutamate racemase [Oscillospiraceae bacterium]
MLKPIGVFDSGIGGLTVVREMVRLMPHEDIVYFGDTARMPYGGKSRKTIIKYACESVDFLYSKNAKFIVAACGTVSTVLEEVLKVFASPKYNIPILGVVGPSCELAVSLSKNHKIGIIGTVSAIRSEHYKFVIKKIDPNVQVFQNACPMLAPLIENGFSRKNDKTLANIAEIYIEPLLKEKIDTLILGCTHYPIIKEVISKIAPSIKLIDSGQAAAKKLCHLLTKSKLTSDKKTPGELTLYASDLTENFSENTKLFLGKETKLKLCKF